MHPGAGSRKESCTASSVGNGEASGSREWKRNGGGRRVGAAMMRHGLALNFIKQKASKAKGVTSAHQNIVKCCKINSRKLYVAVMHDIIHKDACINTSELRIRLGGATKTIKKEKQ